MMGRRVLTNREYVAKIVPRCHRNKVREIAVVLLRQFNEGVVLITDNVSMGPTEYNSSDSSVFP